MLDNFMSVPNLPFILFSLALSNKMNIAVIKFILNTCYAKMSTVLKLFSIFNNIKQIYNHLLVPRLNKQTAKCSQPTVTVIVTTIFIPEFNQIDHKGSKGI